MWVPWSENIKKRACRYLLQRYLGNFLLEKLTLDQLSVDLYNGTGTVSDVSLDCEALNELGDSQSWPLEIVDGYMNQITVTIPWSTLFKDDSVVEVNGLSITVQPKVRNEQASGMLESMWSSMSSSMQLAAECLRQEDGPPDAHPVEGIEMFAHAIDSILTRVKIKFINTKIRIEHVPKNSGKGIAMEIHVKKIDYFDEASTEPLPNQTDPEKTKTYIVSTFTSKKIAFEGVTLYTDEFPSKLRTMAPSLIMEKSVTSQTKDIDASILESDINFQSATSEVFSEIRSTTSEPSEAVKDDFLEQISNPEVRREATPEERANQPDPILFAKLTGIQDLTLKIKHTEESMGPKVEIQLTLGSFLIFCSPRQLHTLFELADGISQPHLEDTSNIPMRSTNNLQCKPMRQADYQYIEQQLHANFTKQSNKYTFGHGWSGHSFDDSDVESDKFHPMSGAQMADSFSSSVSSMSASMTSSVHVPTSQPRIKRNKKVPQVDGDPTAEVSHINITIASCSCILLHKDVLARDPISVDCISPTSARKMQDLSAQFFQQLGLFYLIGNFKDIDAANEAFDKATNRSHLRLITTSLSFDGNEKTTNQGSQTSGQGLITNLLLRECLYYDNDKPESFDLIRFNANDDEESNENAQIIEPNVSITFIQTLKYVRVSGEKKLLHPTTEISIKCNPLYADVELTIIERMAATFFGSSTSNMTMQQTPVSRSQNQLHFSLDCPKLDAILRFPIADLRPGINREIRRVRSDYLLFKFEDVFVTCLQEQSVRPLPTSISIMASTIDLYYHENENIAGTHIARTNKDVTVDSNILKGAGMILPTISLTFQPSKPSKGPFDSSDEEPCDPHSPSLNPMTQSIYLMDKVKDTSQPSPFSSKKMAHQGILSHENNKSHTEELIEPGSEAEMEQFTRSSIEHSNIHLDLNFPIVSLQLESKQIYEIIYNRINSDLLLWEPQTTPYDITPLMPFTTDILPEPSIYPAFGICKSGNAYESDSSSSSSEEDNVYYSIYDPKLKSLKNNNKNKSDKKGNHNFCFTMNIANGLMTVYTPVRDNNKRVVPCQLGELVVKASKVSMCQVSGVNGRSRHALMCLRASQATLYHASLISVPAEKPPLRLYKSSLPSHLKETIYPSGPNVLLKDRVAKKDMLALALSVEPHNDLPNFKKVCMALGIEQGSLRHRGNAGISWLTQLLDVLDVLDYPIPGYQPSTVLTEMHVHMMDCAVDYRPLYLPIRTVLTFGNFSVSSNVVAQTNSTNLKFLAQECALFLHHIPGTKPGVSVPLDDDKQPDLHKDYICVIDLGLFELSLKMNDKADHTGPHVDLCASNNAVNVRTCWDSASALCRLVTYIAADGDTTALTDTSGRHSSFCSDRTDEPLLAGLDDKLEEIPELSPSEIQQVNDLMEEAMQESPNTTLDDEDMNISSDKDGVEIFFFPDEPNSKQKANNSTESISFPIETEGVVDFGDFTSGVPDAAEEAKPTTVQVIKELGDPTSTPKESPKKGKRMIKTSGGDTDDEYCIIESQTPGEDDDLAEPVIKWFTNEPVPMIENHFTVPAAKSDVLKAPKSFPTPVLRYTLYEMSITWHMYGGSDFKTTPDCSSSQTKKNVTINETENKAQGSPTAAKRNIDYEPYETSRATTAAYRQTGVAWSSGHDRVRTHKSEMPTRDIWKTRGGKDRDLNTLVQMQLSKIKFQHEVYPSGGSQASRQTLAVAKIEIIDRLANSSINKFLSQYVLKDEPERKNAHMLVIKAVHLRPEPAIPAQECCLKVSLLPLRFIIDQDTLAFLISFFSKLGSDEPNDEDNKSLGGLSTESSGSRQTTPTHRAPVMSVANHLKDPPPTPTSLTDSDHDASHVLREEPLMENYEAERLVSENLIQLEEDFQKLGVTNERQTAQPTPDAELTDDSPVYFRRVVFAPDVPIRLDYVGKRVDFSAGPVTGLLMGLGQLNCSELRLKRLYHRHGLLGLEKLLRWALQEWLADIKLHQLPGLLSGIGPMHSLLQFITGIRDLVWLPVEQWRRDGRLVHGLRRGAASFTARTAVAALDITTRLIHVIQATAETAFDMLTPGPTLQLQQTYERRQRRRRRRYDPSRQPSDIREGVASAYQTVKEGFAETAATMALAARSERGVGVLRHLPGAAVAPLALAAAGAADVLGGVRAQLAPDLRRDHADRWRPHQHSSMD